MSVGRRTSRLRVGAYAVCVQDECLLLARLSGAAQGRWTLPGGGIDHGEDPLDAVVREVCEETGLDVEVDALLGLDSVRVDLQRNDTLVDHHALRLVYAVTVTGGELQAEVGGSTDQAAWVPLADIGELSRIGLVDVGLELFGSRPATGRL